MYTSKNLRGEMEFSGKDFSAMCAGPDLVSAGAICEASMAWDCSDTEVPSTLSRCAVPFQQDPAPVGISDAHLKSQVGLRPALWIDRVC